MHADALNIFGRIAYAVGSYNIFAFSNGWLIHLLMHTRKNTLNRRPINEPVKMSALVCVGARVCVCKWIVFIFNTCMFHIIGIMSVLPL